MLSGKSERSPRSSEITAEVGADVALTEVVGGGVAMVRDDTAVREDAADADRIELAAKPSGRIIRA